MGMTWLNLSSVELRLLILLMVVMTLAVSWRVVVNHPSVYFALTGPPPHRVSLTPADGSADDMQEVPPKEMDICYDDAGIFTIDPEGIWVQIEGQVQKPGVYRLPPGTRLFMLLQHAGGVADGGITTGFNLTEELRDGQKVVIMEEGSGSEPDDERININTSSAERLQELPGIGPALAERIVEYRQRHGSFSSIDELAEVSGIGAATVDELREWVTLW